MAKKPFKYYRIGESSYMMVREGRQPVGAVEITKAEYDEAVAAILAEMKSDEPATE